MKKREPDFLTDQYSPVFNRLFFIYAKYLFRRRFQSVWVNLSAFKRTSPSYVFIGNHNSWWDALLPLLLNEQIFRLKGRAIMDENQLRKYPFFRKIGTFSINRENPRRALKSLDYAAELLNGTHAQEGIALWFYPEGILKGHHVPISLESGLAWMSRRLDPDKCNLVPFSITMHTMRSDRPELFIKFGSPMGRSWMHAGDLLTRTTRNMEDLRRECQRDSVLFGKNGHPESGYKLLLGSPPKT